MIKNFIFLFILTPLSVHAIDYYNTRTGGQSICGNNFSYSGLNIGVADKEFAGKYLGREFSVLHGENKIDVVSVSGVGCDRVFNDGYVEPEGFIIHTPILKDSEGGKKEYSAGFAISSKHKVKNYKGINSKEHKKENALKYKEMVIKFADRHKKLKWFTIGIKFEIIQYEKSEDGRFDHLYTSFGQFLIYKNKVIYANSSLGKHQGLGIIRLGGQVDIDGKTYLIIRTDVKGMGTSSAFTGLFLFENGEIKKYVAPKYMPTFFGHGFFQE